MSDVQATEIAGLPVKNIVLVGRAGNGKSATGNSLVRERSFISGAQATGVTMTCQTFRAVTEDLHRHRLIINVIDTPGLFDLSKPAEYISKEIVRCLALVDEGLHAVMLVLSVRTRITQEEQAVVSTLQNLFGSRILDYLIVVFTGGDDLKHNGQTLDDYLDKCPEFLKEIFSLCGNRTVLFNNRTDDKEEQKTQIQQVLAHVAAIESRNGGRPFTEEMHRQIREATNRLREEERIAAARVAEEAERDIRASRESYDSSMASMAQLVKISDSDDLNKEGWVENTINDAMNSHQAMMRLMEAMVTTRREQDPRPACTIM